MRVLTALTSLFIGLGAAYADALPANQIAGLFGPEFTFTGPGGEVSPAARNKLRERFIAHLVDGQPVGARFTNPYVYSFISPNGWWFEMTEDPGVVEVKMKPMSVLDFKRFESDIQDAVFATAANEGLFPWNFLGGGHINMDIKIFGRDLLLARNFVVDYYNHNELSMGIFGYNTNTAPPLQLNTEEAQQAVAEIIAQFDRGEFAHERTPLATFLTRLSNATHASGPGRSAWGTDGVVGKVEKYVDMNFSHVAMEGRIEFRAVRPQASLNVWINQIELLQERIGFLRTIRVPIPLKPKVPLVAPLVMDLTDEGHGLNPPIEAQMALRAFYEYVAESGLEWVNHRTYIWPKWIENGELEKFEASRWFKAGEGRRAVDKKRNGVPCTQILGADAA